MLKSKKPAASTPLKKSVAQTNGLVKISASKVLSNKVVPVKIGWAVTDEQKMQKEEEVYDAAKQLVKFRPEVIIKADEKRLLRFLSDGPLCQIQFYNLQYNKFWTKFTKPLDEDDLIGPELNMDAIPYYVYEVFDKEGFVKADGTKMKNIVRYWVVTRTTNKRILKIREKCGPLSNYALEIERTGSGTDTDYQFWPESPSPMPKIKPEDRLNKKWPEHFAPLTVDQQKVLLSKISRQ